MPDPQLVSSLMDYYVVHKDKLHRDAGGRGYVDYKRLSVMVKPKIEKMAEVIDGWDVKPDVIMAAVFSWALYNKHPDGPMPNMLGSSKYLTKALSHYLQVPYDVVVDRKCMALFLEKMDYEHAKFRAEIEHAGITKLVNATSYPVASRYVTALNQGDLHSAFLMSEELLRIMDEDRRIVCWLVHRGITYENVAKMFNKLKKQATTK